jgi:hypothetical protein
MPRSGGKPADVAALAAALFFALALAGCSFGESDSAQSASGAPVRKPTAANSEMVAAVSTSRSEQGLVDMRFALAKRPKVGEPVDIEVSLMPSVTLERLFVRFQAIEGLQIVSGGQTEQLENAPGGVAIGHKVTVLPKQDGIFYITAVVVADSEKESISRTFSIPLVAGEGLAVAPAAPPAASVSEPVRASTPQ